ncbi:MULTISPECIES: preprotein translocase subunit SecE [Gloeobacter]|uniref:Protein translocase subunit SecE n=2 Tax=Gloeobacter TaxID=33071 RepID=Q7NMD7_GLOVI|nr:MULTISPECIES: preprotein translocase subunit SecE [Gloeobacter]UFP93564.1 preprotein translocase subunit SecE [Gloeobacter morelensis MG652769]BAC88770.1 preprotein translocase subunit [Gloeobacter violaceus PCC 7421]
MTTEPKSTSPEVPAKFNPRQFLTEVRGELDKVVWPDRKQLISQSVSVVLIVVVIASFIYLLDELLKWLSGLIF